MKLVWIITLGSYAALAILHFTHMMNWVGCLLIAGFATYLAIGIIFEICKTVKYGPRYGSRRKIIHISILVVLILASVAVVVNQVNIDKNEAAEIYAKLQPFESTQSEYASINPVKQSSKIPVKGKAVVVDKEEKKIDADLFLSLPDDLAAKNPDETAVVVLVQRGESKVGRYTNGGGAYIYTCEVTVVDLATHALIAEKGFRGGPPPEEIRTGDGYGSRPDDDVIKYLTGLLRNEPQTENGTLTAQN